MLLCAELREKEILTLVSALAGGVTGLRALKGNGRSWRN